jgi:hypothetical protein
MSCKYCYNTGRILVELGSSQSYPCPDCTRVVCDEVDDEHSGLDAREDRDANLPEEPALT